MGNVPSKEPQGRPPHNKLSKPRVDGHPTTSSLDKSHRLISIPYSDIATSDANDDNDDDLHSHGAPDKPSFFIPPRVQRRLSLFRSKSSQEPSDRRKSRRNTIIGPPSLPSAQGAIARANSVSTPHEPAESPNSVILSIPEGYISQFPALRSLPPSSLLLG